MSVEIAKAIAVLTAEFDLPEFAPERIQIWMTKLGVFPAGVVTRAVSNFIDTSKFKPQLSDILDRCKTQLDGNWLGADEAWALMPKSEADSALMTEEIAQAMASATELLQMGDKVAARMAFRDAYTRLVEKAKLEGRQPVYFPSFGTDVQGRLSMLASAVTAGHIAIGMATDALPEHAYDLVKMLGVKNHPLLAGPSPEGKKRLASLLLTLKTAKP